MANSIGLAAFSRRMNKVAGGVGKNSVDMMKEAYLAGGVYLVTHTPVKTGLHRSSWIASLGRPSTAVISGITKINIPRGLRLVLTAFMSGGKVFFAISGPAIELLDNGSS